MELMRECEAVALEWGHGATYLNVYERNEGAVRLYTSKLGYEVISEPSTQPRAREGRPGPAGPLPVFRMRKTLVGAPIFVDSLALNPLPYFDAASFPR